MEVVLEERDFLGGTERIKDIKNSRNNEVVCLGEEKELAKIGIMEGKIVKKETGMLDYVN